MLCFEHILVRLKEIRIVKIVNLGHRLRKNQDKQSLTINCNRIIKHMHTCMYRQLTNC